MLNAISIKTNGNRLPYVRWVGGQQAFLGWTLGGRVVVPGGEDAFLKKSAGGEVLWTRGGVGTIDPLGEGVGFLGCSCTTPGAKGTRGPKKTVGNLRLRISHFIFSLVCANDKN